MSCDTTYFVSFHVSCHYIQYTLYYIFFSKWKDFFHSFMKYKVQCHVIWHRICHDIHVTSHIKSLERGLFCQTFLHISKIWKVDTSSQLLCACSKGKVILILGSQSVVWVISIRLWRKKRCLQSLTGMTQRPIGLPKRSLSKSLIPLENVIFFYSEQQLFRRITLLELCPPPG